MRELRVTTGARLHFGLFGLNADLNRCFGGIGMMIDSPGVTLKARTAEHDQIRGEPEIQSRVTRFLGRLREAWNDVPPVHIEVLEFIPSHRGLGSGTQLALAMARAVDTLVGSNRSAVELAMATGRGARSAVGIHGFDLGGCLFDAGHAPGEPLGKIAARVEVPPEWRVVLVTPDDRPGLSGSSEQVAFDSLPPMPESLSTTLEQLVATEIVPAIEQTNFPDFAAALQEFGDRVGRFFEPVQGGVLRSPRGAQIVAHLREHGARVVVQSSWGPTLCAMAPDEETADRLRRQLPPDLHAEVTRPRNHGASESTPG